MGKTSVTPVSGQTMDKTPVAPQSPDCNLFGGINQKRLDAIKQDSDLLPRYLNTIKASPSNTTEYAFLFVMDNSNASILAQQTVGVEKAEFRKYQIGWMYKGKTKGGREIFYECDNAECRVQWFVEDYLFEVTVWGMPKDASKILAFEITDEVIDYYRCAP